MISIGIRAAPKEVTFAIYDSDTREVVNVEEIKMPKAFSFPDALKHLRGNLLDIIREYQVTKAGLRTSEPNAQKLNVPRVQIEGVIQEAFSSGGLEAFFAGPIAVAAAKLEIPRKSFKELLDADEHPCVENWSKMSPAKKEAILCAMGATNA